MVPALSLLFLPFLGMAPPAEAKQPSYELINLYDAFGDQPEGTTEHFGFSALVRYGDTTILFDAGTNADILAANVKAMGIDLAEVDLAVASHAHNDHTGGFDALIQANPDVTIYFPQDFFGAGAPLEFGIAGTDPTAREALPESHRYFDGKSETAKLHGTGRFYKAVEYISEPTELAPGVRLVPTTSTNMGYFTKYPGVDLHGNPAEGEAKFLGLPELSLALDTPEGQVVVVGCSHSGVEAIVEAARSAGDVALVAGGFHLLPYDRETLDGIVGRLKKELGVKAVAPAHCTGHLAFVVLREEYGEAYRFFGLGSRLEG